MRAGVKNMAENEAWIAVERTVTAQLPEFVRMVEDAKAGKFEVLLMAQDASRPILHLMNCTC
jgi:hypothetical protein